MLTILATWEAETGRMAVEGQAGQKKLARPHFNKKKI
jgi:hypothetical protein